jgi:hypothetical protein
MTTEIVLAPARPPVPTKSLPALIERAGGAARFAWDEFFFAEHHNPHTQRKGWGRQIASWQRPVRPAGCARSVGSALTASQLATIGDSAWYSCISPRNQRRQTGCSPKERRESPGRRADRLV